MFLKWLILILLKIHLILSINQNINRLWTMMNSTKNYSNEMNLTNYLKQGYCQLIANTCNSIPKLPRPRKFHSAIYYTTFNKTQSDSMCPKDLCGPLCLTSDPSCNGTSIYDSEFRLPYEGEKLFNFTSPESELCPKKCCADTNEYCFRTHDSSGNEIQQDNEMMLIFGGISELDVKINDQKVLDDCDKIKLDSLLTDDRKNWVSIVYLINNCGIELLNEIWTYNLKTDIWTFIKPYVNVRSKMQPKPAARYGHASVYVEKLENIAKSGKAILRKFMYIYGGFSLYCENACSDFWMYEIPYAPLRYYPSVNSQDYSVGNIWSEIHPANKLNPGKRIFHSMVIDSNFKYIYLYGGVCIDSNNKYYDNNDLWRFDIFKNIWEKVNMMGVSEIKRTVVFWDGTFETRDIEYRDYNKLTDVLEYNFLANNPHTRIPSSRASANLIFSQHKNSTYLFLFGGFTFENDSGNREITTLNDNWIFILESQRWMEVYPNSFNPSPRYGSKMIELDEITVLLFGGFNLDSTLNDLWLFNRETSMWSEIKNYNTTGFAQNWPNPIRDFSLIKSSINQGIWIYGGEFIVPINSDPQVLKNSNRFSYPLNDVWFLDLNKCPNDCNDNGTCKYGRCMCNKGFFGIDCNKTFCKNSICVTDIDNWTYQNCYHCSGHGNCVISSDKNATCVCDSGWTGEDCSIQDCPNSCSNKDNPEIGKCIIRKPISQCDCNQKLKRGGDDCSVIFCLNACIPNGVCNYTTGDCNCNNEYYGIDCSLHIPNFRNISDKFNINYFIVFLLVILFLL